MTDHSRVEELLAARALDGLDEADARSLDAETAAHGPDCGVCHDLEHGFGETAASLAMELQPVPIRAGFEDQVMTAAMAARPPASSSTSGAPAEGTAPVIRLDRPGSPWPRRLGALAFAAALLLVGFVAGRSSSVYEGPSADFLASATIVPLEGDAPGTISIAFRPGEAGGYLIGSEVPDAADDDVYALWTITGDEPTLVGCFTPDDGQLDASFEQDVNDADLMAITVEPPACPSAPTTAPILTGQAVTA